MTNNEYKECPYCAEKIKSKAIKCKHCQSFLTEKKSYMPDSQSSEPLEQIIPIIHKVDTTNLDENKSIWRQWWIWVIAAIVFTIIFIYANDSTNTVIQTLDSQTEPIQKPAESTATQDNSIQLEVRYMEDTIRILDNINLYMEALLIAMNPMVTRDDAWAGIIESSTRLIQMAIKEIQELEAPKTLSESHTYLLLYAQELSLAMDYYANHNFNQGEYHLKKASNYLNEASRLLK